MTDLFAFGSAASSNAAEADYGLGGDMKKTQYVLQLLGFPGQADTLKCLIMAVEMGMETDSAVLDILEGQDESSEYLEISPFGMVPALKEAEYYVAGESGIMSYIEARGLGKRLAPKNAALLAEQNYWSDIACSEVGPHVNLLVQERILAQMDDSVYMVKSDEINAAREALAAPLDALNDQLAKNTFIIGNYSFADIHWTAYLHLLNEAGEGDLITERANVKAWFDRVSTHKSFSGQNIVAYDLLPKLADIKNKKLNSIVIDDFWSFEKVDTSNLMMWPFNKADTDINQASETLSPFISTALSRLEAEDIREQGRFRMLAECYIYGAVRYLASYDDMRPANTGILLKSLLARHFDADSIEVNQCLKYCAGVKDGEKEKLFMMEGAGALRRWLVNNDRSVASELKELMEMSNVSVTKVT